MPADISALLAAAKDYLSQSEAALRDELQACAQEAKLRRSSSCGIVGPLRFGTAGLRGREGGLNRMNRVVVARASWGLGRYLLDGGMSAAAHNGVVIGFDGRRMSRQFAEDTAAVLAALGVPCFLFPTVVPTPVCAYAVRALKAAAGVMVTASHNPPQDNGYKVYQSTGGQIILPHDSGIAAALTARRATSRAVTLRRSPGWSALHRPRVDLGGLPRRCGGGLSAPRGARSSPAGGGVLRHARRRSRLR